MMDIRNVTVVGAGTMGHSLAQVFSQEGYSVWLTDVREEILDKAKKLIASNLQTLVEMRLLKKSRLTPTLDRIQTTTIAEEACRNADFVIEAINEDEAAKKNCFTGWIRSLHRKPFWPAIHPIWISLGSSRPEDRTKYSSPTGLPRPISFPWSRSFAVPRPRRRRLIE